MSARRPRLRRGPRSDDERELDAAAPTLDDVLGPDGPAATLAGVPDLVAKLEAAGHPSRWSATPDVAELDPELSRTAYAIVETSVEIICRLLPAGQHLTLRARIDGSDLVLSAQSSGLEGLGQRGLVPEADRAVVRARVAEARGRLALRRTASGNWLGVVTLPL